MLDLSRPTGVAGGRLAPAAVWRIPARPDVIEGLRSYQVSEVERAAFPYWAVYADPRLGKTRIVARSIIRWIEEFGVRKILITGPLEPLRMVWQREMRAIGLAQPRDGGGPLGYLVPLLTQPSAYRARVLRDLIEGAAGDRPVVVLINDEVLHQRFGLDRREHRGGVKIGFDRRSRIVDAIVQWAPEAMVGDEAQRYKNAGAGRTRALTRIASPARFRRLLSGTPDPNGYLDFYAQFKILDPSVFGTNKAAFVRRYCRAEGRFGERIKGYTNVDELLDKVRTRASIIRAADYSDVPPVEEVTRHIELPPKVRAMYDKLVKEQILKLEQEAVAIDATHILARLTRCQQLTSGYLPQHDDEGRQEGHAWLHTAKIDAVVADVGELISSGGKVIISHRFRPEADRLVEALRRKYGERSTYALNGNTHSRDRAAIVGPFDVDVPDTGGDARILVTQEQVGGVGISLGRADHLLFYSWSFDFGAVEQMRKRIWTFDKKRMTITFLAVPKTVDRTALAAVQRKGAASIMARTLPFQRLLLGEVNE